MSKPTKDQITKEIAALEACKTYAPKTTVFGDDNHAGIDLQIETLRSEIDTTAAEFYETFTEDEISTITDAQMWRDGDREKAPSSDWDEYKP